MANNIMLMSDSELAVAVNNIERRRVSIETPSGIERATMRILDIIQFIVGAGYKTETDPTLMAKIWTSMLKDEIITYGSEVILEAVKAYIKNDTREYKQFPGVGDIIAYTHTLGYNPEVELARRRAEKLIADMQAEHKREVQKILTPEYRADLERRYGHLWKSQAETTQ